MKIAIHTLIGHRNYGCILQAYALQTVLEKEGHTVTIINRRENKPNNKLLLRRILSVLRDVFKRYICCNKRIIIGNPYDYCYNQRYLDVSLLKEFTNNKLKYTKLFRTSNAIARFANNNNFDAYVVGSDQVWRERYVPCITDSFLGYLSQDNKAIKISYAASFGTKDFPISVENLAKCIELAKKFNSISVRELSGVHIMKELFGMDATHVLDPTLLLEHNDYNCFIKGNDIGKNRVVSYILDITEEKKRIVDETSVLLNFQRFDLMDYPINKNGSKMQYSVEDWISAISNAKFVVTDSFHGCVFSIIFNKPFIVIANKGRGMERFVSLLGVLELKNRMIYSLDDFTFKKEELLCDIDYIKVNNRLMLERNKSMSFLFESLYLK